jgi:hypothetical protein
VSERCISQLKTAKTNGCTDDIPSVFRDLAEVTLAEIETFNRRRQGEVAKLTVDDYSKRTTVNMSSDIQAGLSAMEQNLCRLFSRVEVTGKRDRIVLILLTEQMPGCA